MNIFEIKFAFIGTDPKLGFIQLINHNCLEIATWAGALNVAKLPVIRLKSIDSARSN